LNLAGEFLVAAELNRRQIVCPVTYGEPVVGGFCNKPRYRLPLAILGKREQIVAKLFGNPFCLPGILYSLTESLLTSIHRIGWCIPSCSGVPRTEDEMPALRYADFGCGEGLSALPARF
jgi:hypothetical protein